MCYLSMIIKGKKSLIYADIDFSIQIFNKWNDDEHLKDLIQVNETEKKNDEQVSMTEKSLKLPGVMKTMRNFRLFSGNQQF